MPCISSPGSVEQYLKTLPIVNLVRKPDAPKSHSSLTPLADQPATIQMHKDSKYFFTQDPNNHADSWVGIKHSDIYKYYDPR